jgi:flagellar protein FliO/FliZ
MKSYLNVACRCPSVALSLLFLAPLASATDQDAIAGPMPVGSAEVLSVLGGLFSVIAAIFVVSFLYGRLKGPRIGGNNVINIVASQALGPKERIALIEIANTQLVVGITTTNVQTLHVFNEPVVKAAETNASSGFAERFKQALRGERK